MVVLRKRLAEALKNLLLHYPIPTGWSEYIPRQLGKLDRLHRDLSIQLRFALPKAAKYILQFLKMRRWGGELTKRSGKRKTKCEGRCGAGARQTAGTTEWSPWVRGWKEEGT